MNPENNFDLVVMGDINLDWVSKGSLNLQFANLITNGVIEWTAIDELPGGSGLNFAMFAREAGYKPLLLGKIGVDQAGDFLLSQLKSSRLAEGISRTDTAGTGKAFIARDKNGIRLLINNEPNTNRLLSVDDIDLNGHAIRSCKVLYISGYCIMHPDAPRKMAAQKAIKLARANPLTCIVFDVVPHQIYNIYTFPELLELTAGVDILISEVATMRRYFHLGDKTETITREMVEETVERLHHHFDKFILRYGPSGCDEQVISTGRSAELIWEITGHDTAADKRGYGDRIAIQSLISHFGLLPQKIA